MGKGLRYYGVVSRPWTFLATESLATHCKHRKLFSVMALPSFVFVCCSPPLDVISFQSCYASPSLAPRCLLCMAPTTSCIPYLVSASLLAKPQ
jgi:hypothetical protein